MIAKWKTAIAIAVLLSGSASAAESGISDTEIKIGGVFPFSGPASSNGLGGKALIAYVQSLNDRGGVNGRKINHIAYDDSYSPPKAVEQVRKLVESDEVSFMFGQLGTPGISATAKYLSAKGVPSIAVVSGASKFGDVATFPMITTGLPSFDTEGKIYAKYLAKTLPNAKYAILYQNDDLGKDYVNTFKGIFWPGFRSEGRDGRLRDHRPDDRFADHDSEEFGSRGSLDRGYTEVCGTGNKADFGDRMEGNRHH